MRGVSKSKLNYLVLEKGMVNYVVTRGMTGERYLS